MAAERFWLSIDGGAGWLQVGEKEFREVERALGFLPTAAFTVGSIRGTTLDPAQDGGNVMGLRQLSNKWMCPQCGSRGVSQIGTPGCVAPLCHERGCDYQVVMFNISDTLYNKLGYQGWKASAYDRKLEDDKVPQCVRCGKYIFVGTHDEDGFGMTLRCIGCFKPQEGCTCDGR